MKTSAYIQTRRTVLSLSVLAYRMTKVSCVAYLPVEVAVKEIEQDAIGALVLLLDIGVLEITTIDTQHGIEDSYASSRPTVQP